MAMATKTKETPKTPTKTVKVQDLEVEVPEYLLDDFEFVEAYAQAEQSAAKMVGLFKLVFGDDQFSKIKDHIRTTTGYVSVKVLAKFFAETIEAINPNS